MLKLSAFSSLAAAASRFSLKPDAILMILSFLLSVFGYASFFDAFEMPLSEAISTYSYAWIYFDYYEGQIAA